ncbi:MAG: protein-L-isoaspartate(D-aspartate) O-methyltransferase [Flavobacteriales bacterium]
MNGNDSLLQEEHMEMIEDQIVARGIKDDGVIQAMKKVPRHRFVPSEHLQKAYEDHPLPIGEGQTISQPYVVAKMTELLNLEGDEKVLEIGTGSGYQAAILGELAEEVHSVEIRKSLADKARNVLTDLEYGNVHVHHANGYKGWPEDAPYEGIIVTAAPETVPDALKEQLAVGGKLVIPVGDMLQHLKVYTKTKAGEFKEKSISSVQFVPMVRDTNQSGDKR